MIMIIMILIIIIIIIILYLFLLIKGNYSCHFTVIPKQGHRKLRHSTDHVVTVERFKTAVSSHINHPTSDGIQIIIDSPPRDPYNDRGEECTTVTQNCLKYLVFRITEILFYYSEIIYNLKLILECCFRFVAYRVKCNYYTVGVSGCVSVSHWFRE
jgi:hypothetical protein